MEAWVFTIVISLCIAALLKSLYDFIFPKQKKLPPGPPTVPFLGSLLWLLKSPNLEPTLRDLHAKYGPIVTLPIGSRPSIFVSDNALAHQALVQNGALFADRPEALPFHKVLTCNQHNITSASYGPTWRLLRRNLTAEILHPSRVRGYSPARKWVLEILTSRLRDRSESGEAIRVVDHFQYAMFCLLVMMCFGDKLEEKQIQEIESIQRRRLLSLSRFNILNFWPGVGKLLFRRRWEEFYQLLKNQEDLLLPYIRARQKLKQEIQSSSSSKNYCVLSYVDTLLDLQLPGEENRKLNEREMVCLCSEFLNAGTDTTSTALQWIMANLVKHPHIQAKLFEEINGVVGEEGKNEVEEEDLQKMPYLKAVILEGLRRHPPGHFVLPHSVSQDITFEGYDIPKNASLNFLVAEMNWNPKIWEDPMGFKPERFLSSNSSSSSNNNGEEVVLFDITGSREIKMMPFGAGRRICPGYGLAILHLEYFVANLVWRFEWKGVEGEEVDLSEKQEFTVVMKNPLQVHLSLRRK